MRLLTGVPSSVLSAVVSHQWRRAFSVAVLELSIKLGVTGQPLPARSPNARTIRAPREPQATRSAPTDRPYPPLPAARHRRLQTSYAIQPFAYAGNWGPTLRVTGGYTIKECISASLSVTDNVDLPAERDGGDSARQR
jgi:hypothetical protein